MGQDTSQSYRIHEELVLPEFQKETPVAEFLEGKMSIEEAVKMTIASGSHFFIMNSYWMLSTQALAEQRGEARRMKSAPGSIEKFGLMLLESLDRDFLCLKSIINSPSENSEPSVHEIGPMYATANLGWGEALGFWIDAGADPNLAICHQSEPYSVLFGCMQSPSGETSALQAMLRRNMVFNPTSSPGDITLTHMASLGRRNAHHFLGMLRENGFLDLESVDEQGRKPIHFSAFETSDNSASRWLIENGADPKCIDKNGNTPIHEAAKNHRSDVCKILICLGGANPNTKNNKGETPLHFATKNMDDDTFETMKSLIEFGGDPTIENNKGETPMGIISDPFYRLVGIDIREAVEREWALARKESLQINLSGSLFDTKKPRL